MGIQLAIPKETKDGEKRVAASPESVKKYIAGGASVSVQSGAGEAAAFTDDAYKNAGAKIVKSYSDTLKGADIVLKVQAPGDEELQEIAKGTLLVAMLSPFANKDILQKCAKAEIDTFSMEFVPRITRAQSMDVLSSQSNLAGYKSVLDACEFYPHAMPMMMTAAGTVPPAKVFVMGAGVAGLQAIATARRLGAIVSATDVRPAAKEQVESLGANFIAVEDEEFKQAETAGGYAKEMSAEYKKKQSELVEKHISKQDIVITTALIPGRAAPKLISKDMVASMKPGSVIVDLAVETGGNCELSKNGEVLISDNGVTIVGHRNVPSRLAADSSALYAKNLLALMNLIIDKEQGALNIDWDDEIIQGVCMTRGGAVVHPAFGGGKTGEKTAEEEKASKAEAKAETKAEAKPKTEDKPKAKPKAKSDSKPKTKTKAKAKTKAKTEEGK